MHIYRQLYMDRNRECTSKLKVKRDYKVYILPSYCLKR